MRLLLALLGILFLILGFEALDATPWFGWVDISLGVLALLSAPSAGTTTRYLAPLGPIAVGAGAMLLCLTGAFAQVATPLLWGTLCVGLVCLVTAAVPILGGGRARL